MPEWQDRREFYLRHGCAGDQAHEDMLAARVLSGLGAKRSRDPATMSRIEQAVLGEARGSLPMWQRAQEIFIRLLCNGNAVPHIARLWNPQALLIKDHSEAQERVTVVQWDLSIARPLLFTRKKNTDICNVYTFWTPDELMLIKPPLLVLPYDDYPARLFVQQDAAHFVEQFGPYYVYVE